MADKSKIAWTDASWNAVIGCSHVSEGCRNCYAESLSLRRGWTPKPWTAPNAAENVILKPLRLDAPVHWAMPRMVFVNSLSDVFHEQIPEAYIDLMFAVMAVCPQHVFQILTKRPERMRAYVEGADIDRVLDRGWAHPNTRDWWPKRYKRGALTRWPLSNVWLGVSVEDQSNANKRIPILLETQAAVRFLSCEPLLGPVELAAFGGIDWVIVGGESGPHYRPMDLDWARAILHRCQVAGVPFFFKQSSGRYPATSPTLDGVVWHQFPTVADGAAAAPGREAVTSDAAPGGLT